MTTLAEIEAAALALPESDRIALGRRLIDPTKIGSTESPLSFQGESSVLLRRLLERRWTQHVADPSSATDVDEFLAELEAEDRAEAAADLDAGRQRQG